MKDLIKRISLILFPFFPRLKNTSNVFHNFVRISGLILFMLGVVGYVVLLSESVDTNGYIFTLLVFFFLVVLLMIIINVGSILYYLVLARFFKEKIAVHSISYKEYFVFSVYIITALLLFHFIQSSAYIYVDRQQNFNRFFHTDGYIELTGDWDEDSKLAKEVRKHQIKCEEHKEQCLWITASVQEWNNNFFSVDDTVFEIDSWEKNKVHAVNESETVVEELTFYFDSCKMIYTKTPRSDAAEKSLIGFRPDDITLTMTDTHCLSTRK